MVGFVDKLPKHRRAYMYDVGRRYADQVNFRKADYERDEDMEQSGSEEEKPPHMQFSTENVQDFWLAEQKKD